MWVIALTYVLSMALLIGMLAWRRKDDAVEARPLPPPDPSVGGPRCALCGTPLRSRRTSAAEVVSELEQRIDVETATVSALLAQPTTERIRELYLSPSGQALQA